ncbi:MAG TPA: hypothetical protein VJ652_06280 [Noviherbaspirillum sp.]|nr:hypothetical protein [Noviherbaspirillum sp.]
MAIDDTRPIRGRLPQEFDAAPYGRRPLFSAVRWGAVFAGVVVGISAQLLLTLLGIATGLSVTDIAQGETVGTGPLWWAGLSMLVAAFVGGYVAARMSGLKRRADGVLHGAVSWAVSTILFAMLATSIGGALASGVFNNLSQLASASAGTGTGASASPLAALMRTQGVRMNEAGLRQLQQYLQAGQRDQAVQLVMNATGMDQEKAGAVVDEALILTGSSGAASPQNREATETALQRAGGAAWGVFAAVTLALAIGMGGGMLGAAGSRRVNWAAPPG